MEKFVSCFECDFDYNDVKEERCPKCGEEKIFIPKIHVPNFDMMKDPMELFKTRVIGAAVILSLLIAALIYAK